MSQFRLMVIGAHPDDPDLIAGGLAIRMVRKGHEVMFLSVTDGGAGHQNMTREALVQRRAEEIKQAGRIYGVDYRSLPLPDGSLMPDLKAREMVMREIRAFAPDVIVTHRTCDYHPDHRAVAQIVMDCSYLVGVPLYCPDTPIPSKTPVILSSFDHFTKPIPFQADLAVDTDEVYDQKIEGILAHISQFYEWLPFADGWDAVVAAETFEEKTEELKKVLLQRFGRIADHARALLSEKTRTAESFEWNEYGAPMTEEIKRILTE